LSSQVGIVVIREREEVDDQPQYLGAIDLCHLQDGWKCFLAITAGEINMHIQLDGCIC